MRARPSRLMFPIFPATIGDMSRQVAELAERRELGALLSAVRAARRMSPTELSRRARVDVKTIRSLEIGTRWPQDVTRAKLEAALGMAAGSIRHLRDDRYLREQLWEKLHSGELAGTWETSPENETPSSSTAQEESRPRRSTPGTWLELTQAVDYADGITQLLARLAPAEMDDLTRTLLTRAQVRTIGYLYSVVGGADDVDAAAHDAINVGRRLGEGEPLFLKGFEVAVKAITELARTNYLRFDAAEQVTRTGDAAAADGTIDVPIPGGRGHVVLQLRGDGDVTTTLHDTPPPIDLAAARKLKPGESPTPPDQGVASGEESQAAEPTTNGGDDPDGPLHDDPDST